MLNYDHYEQKFKVKDLSSLNGVSTLFYKGMCARIGVEGEECEGIHAGYGCKGMLGVSK